MKILNSKKGSAMLWTILLTVILTILLGSIMMAAYAYFNYTMYTVKRQQAYFTARSAINVLLEEFTSEEQVRTESGAYKESTIKVLPLSANKASDIEQNAVTVTDFGFDPKMGTATAKITRNLDDEVLIEVKSQYADQDYELNATVVRQPLYFGGIAVKQLTLNGNFTLGDKTDFYWNNTDLFNTAGNGTSLKNNTGSKLTIKGNLVTKGNATITPGNIIANRKFTGTANFTNTSLRYKKIWSPSEYILSNTTLKVGDDNTEYTSSIINTLSRMSATKSVYCNSNGLTGFGGGIKRDGQLFDLLEAIGLEKILDGIADDRLALKNDENDALAIQYIDILSLSVTVTNTMQDFKNNSKTFFGKLAADVVLGIYDRLFKDIAYNTLDVSYIDYSSTDESNRSDEVVPLTYMFVRGGSYQGMKVRVRYGCDPGNRTQLGKIAENITGAVSGVITDIFNIDNKPSYVIMYMEQNGTVHLGYDDDNGRREQSPADLVFLYSLYGDETTTVVLHKNVVVVGEIVCGHLIVEDGAKVIYSSTSGAQVAKQKIAEYWAVSNYSD